MRAGGNRYRQFAGTEVGLELPDEFGAEDVFDHVGIAIDMARSDVSILNKIGFPQAMIPRDARGFAESGFREKDFPGSSGFEVIFASPDFQDFAKLQGRP